MTAELDTSESDLHLNSAGGIHVFQAMTDLPQTCHIDGALMYWLTLIM